MLNAGAGLANSIGFRATFVFCGLVLLATVAVVLWTERQQRDREETEIVTTA